MISIKLVKVVARVGNLSLFSGASAVQSRPKSHSFTENYAVFAPPDKMAVKNPGRVYFIQRCVTALPHVRNTYLFCLFFVFRFEKKVVHPPSFFPINEKSIGYFITKFFDARSVVN